MRLTRLDLTRYGKFTDRQVALPRAKQDFHLILGGNEAGKSTLRSAILDLLFGFPVRTPLDFLHAKTDLRVGAILEHAEQTLEFVRVKGNKKTLRAPDDTPLPDTALDHFLGAAGRVFFDKMFGLDHPRLVEGGNSILSAQDDVGQVLFQSASGLASLGRIRDALEQEADGLWAPTRSSKRAYYMARDDLDQAGAALKAATVRTREWAEAHERVEELTANVEAHRALLAGQQTQRNRLERIRRVSPIMRELDEAERALAALGPVVDLGPDAGQALAQAQRAQAMAQHGLGLRRSEVARLEEEIASIYVDDTVLVASEAIEALETLRHQYGAHGQAMIRCQGQLDQLWRETMQALGELGLAAAEGAQRRGNAGDIQALQARLPGLPARKHMERLLREHGSVNQAVEAAQATHRARQAEVNAIEARLGAQQVADVDADLRAALDAAKALGDPDTALQKALALRDDIQAALDHALAGLGVWVSSPEQLRRQDWPTSQLVASWLAERRTRLADARAAEERCEELDAVARKAALSAKQYREKHHPTTREALGQMRHQRDGVWQAIKRGERAVADAAPEFESLVQRADSLADARHDKAQESAHMQTLQHQREQAEQDLEHARRRLAACQAALAEVDARWRSDSERLALTGLPLEQAPDWLAMKDRVLEADQKLARAKQDITLLKTSHQAACDRLAQALGDTRSPAEGVVAVSLDGLRARAESVIRSADAAVVRQETWRVQIAEARPALDAAQQGLQRALVRQTEWRETWTRALTQLGLDPASSLGSVEGALELIGLAADKLEQMRRLRGERLDVMQDELDAFVKRAAELALEVGAPGQKAPSSSSYTEALDFSRVLSGRLAQARRAHERASSLKQALDAELAEIRKAELVLREAQAKVEPLMDQASVDTLDALATAVVQSDQHRAWRDRVDQAQTRLMQEGDGLTRALLQAELDTVDLGTLPAQWEAVHAGIEVSTQKQSELAVALAEAQRQLDGMAGTDNAARAEARRQDALARMGDAAERYIKVFTAARLLRWSIDRYREEQQGPMLARASAIFAQLTLNSFERLRVDFDKHPMVLEGQRPDGRCVGIAGLSDGTRDQLYLALRLAALELHLDQAPALPFIADDLFINYDDARSEAGLQALAALSRRTQVIFLSHHDALLEPARRVFGGALNVVVL